MMVVTSSLSPSRRGLVGGGVLVVFVVERLALQCHGAAAAACYYLLLPAALWLCMVLL